MTCASCVGRVERALKKESNISEATVNLATEKARVVYDEDALSPEQIIAIVTKAGYEASAVSEKLKPIEKDHFRHCPTYPLR